MDHATWQNIEISINQCYGHYSYMGLDNKQRTNDE